MTPLNRRGFLRIGGAGLALGALSPVIGNPFLSNRLHAAGGSGNPKKMMIVFLRGGNDGVNTVIPHGDSTYNQVERPTLFIPPTASIDLNGFAALHPQMGLMKEVYDTGDLAVIHRVAYDNQSRSHFTSQQLWENAYPAGGGNEEVEEGWVNRLLASDPALSSSPLSGISISNNQQVAFRGDYPLVHMRNIEGYQLGTNPIDLKMVGAAPGGGSDGSGLLGVYGRTPDAAEYDAKLRGIGMTMASSLDALTAAGVDEDAYVPANGAFYPDSTNTDGFSNRLRTFFRQLKNGAQLLKETDSRIVGVELGSFDTHSNQQVANGAHSDNVRGLSRALHSLQLDLTDVNNNIWNDTLILVVSEFGRTSRENGSQGTDHGEASCLFVAGGGINGGTYNCDALTWSDGDMFSCCNNRYVAQRSSFLTIYAEIIDRHFSQPGLLDTVIPAWSTYVGPQYDYVGFMV